MTVAGMAAFLIRAEKGKTTAEYAHRTELDKTNAYVLAVSTGLVQIGSDGFITLTDRGADELNELRMTA